MHRIDPMNRERATAVLVDFCRTKLSKSILHNGNLDTSIDALLTPYANNHKLYNNFYDFVK